MSEGAGGMVLGSILTVPPGGGGGGPAVTWNPADKSAGITLSNGDLTAHMGSDNDYTACGVRGTTSFASGKKYFRMVLDDVTGTDPILGVGIATAAAVFTQIWPTSHSALGNGSAAATVAGFPSIDVDNAYGADGITALVATDIVDVALDFGNLKMWIRKNGTGNWNIVAGDNPATNSGGAVIPAGTYFPYFAGRNGVGVTARFADDASGTAPAGFSWWQ